KVAVLGSTVAHQLFPGSTDPIGQSIRIANTPFRVIGVLAPKGTSVTGDDQDDVVVIPWTTAQRRMLGIKYIKDIFASAQTREIGVRMAVGARGGTIRLQFLLEAMLLSLVGGLAGVGVGIAASFIVAGSMRWPPVISTTTVAMGLGISTAVGLVFGYYPALR